MKGVRNRNGEVSGVLVYMTGSLGDTIATVPSLWAVRGQWPGARVMVVSDAEAGRGVVRPAEVLRGAGVVDGFWVYPGGTGWRRWVGKGVGLWRGVREQRPEVMVYLARAWPGERRLWRDRWFFRGCGVRRLVGFGGLGGAAEEGSRIRSRITSRNRTGRLKGGRMADLHLEQIGADGVRVPERGKGRMELGLNREDHEEFERWRAALEAGKGDGGRIWVGFGVGSKGGGKRWPLEGYEAVGRQLVERRDVWPVVFGGEGEREAGRRLVGAWGRGYVAAGELGVRAAGVGLRRCRAFVGNDSGTMHLAAAVGTRCVGIFSAREARGLWEPYGEGHVVLRREVGCAGCGEAVCPSGEGCLRGIGAEAVGGAVMGILEL